MPMFRQANNQTIHNLLSDSGISDTPKDTYTLYRLQHACYHQVMLRDTERIWKTLNDTTYNDQQVSHTKDYQWTNASIKYGLAHFVSQQGATVEDDARLSWLVLRAGEVAREAIEGVDIAFEWFKEDASLLDDALKRIEVLDEENYFKACLRLMMIEAWRQEEWAVERRDISVPQTILEALDEWLLEGIGTVNWSDFLVPNIVADIVRRLHNVWSTIDLSPIYQRGSQLDLIQALEHVSSPLSGGMLERMIQIATDITIAWDACCAWRLISSQLYRLGLREEAESRIQQAFESATLLDDDWDKAQALALVATELLKQSRVVQSEQTLQMARQTAERIEDELYRSETWCEMAREYLTHGYLEQAEIIAQLVLDPFERTNIDALISTAFHTLQNTDRAEHFLTGAMDRAKTIENALYRSEAFVVIATESLVQHKFDCVEQALTSVSDVWEQARITAEMATVRWSLGDLEVAQSLNETALQHAQTIRSAWRRLDALTDIAQQLIAQDAVDGVLDLLDTLDDVQVRSRIHSQVAVHLVQSERLDSAWQIVDKITEPLDRLNAWHSVLIYAHQASDIPTVELMWNQIRSLTSTMNIDRETGEILSGISRKLEVNDMVEYARILMAISLHVSGICFNNRGQSNVMYQISSTYWMLGQQSHAELLLQNAVQVAEQLTDEIECAQVLGGLAWKCAQDGRLERGRQMASDISDNFERHRALFNILTVLIQSDIDAALRLASEMDDAFHQSKSLAAIAVGLANVNDVERSIEVSGQIVFAMQQIQALIGISIAADTQGDVDKATHCLEQAKDLVPSLSNKRGQSQVLKEIALAHAEQQRFEQAVSVANSIAENMFQAQALTSIAIVCHQSEQFEQFRHLISSAMDVANLISEAWDRVRVCCAMSKMCYASGLYEQATSSLDRAIELSDCIENPWYHSQAIVEISGVYLAQGDRSKALHLIVAIDQDRSQSEALLHLITSLTLEELGTIHQYIGQGLWSQQVWSVILLPYQEKLTNTQHLRQSYLFAPFIPGLGEASVLNTINHHLRQGNTDVVHAIIRQCPQLDLDFLLPENAVV